MKFSLAFLCALVVISHQQLQKPRGLVWFSPYYSLTNPSPVINNYPAQYYGSHPDDESLFFRNLRIAYPQVKKQDYGIYGTYISAINANAQFLLALVINNPAEILNYFCLMILISL
jgi:hypothetical protein